MADDQPKDKIKKRDRGEQGLTNQPDNRKRARPYQTIQPAMTEAESDNVFETTYQKVGYSNETWAVLDFDPLIVHSAAESTPASCTAQFGNGDIETPITLLGDDEEYMATMAKEPSIVAAGEKSRRIGLPKEGADGGRVTTTRRGGSPHPGVVRKDGSERPIPGPCLPSSEDQKAAFVRVAKRYRIEPLRTQAQTEPSPTLARESWTN
ncbi:hypothetical protein GGR54DRAFT_644547 [Hypoxylon sp. NC1633]|nr:hypothetical protein GGR54DRAFT_644547 [Hypoxylon sp. NC1633]